MFNKMIKMVIFQAVVIFAVALATVLPPAGGETASKPEGAGEMLRTKGIGEMGSIDNFLTDVVPDWPGWSRRYWTDKELWGNQGYIIGGPRKKMETAGPLTAGAAEELTAIIESPPVPEAPLEKFDLDALKEKPDYHTVVKGECLWYIAGYERIYGNPLKWPLIYKANKDRIKNPDLIYPGQVFVIPR